MSTTRISSPTHSRVHTIPAEIGPFALMQARACAFAGPFLLLLLVARHVHVPWLAHYDLLLVGALGIQVALIKLKLEPLREVFALAAFHALGLGLEVFKTSSGIGSWSYPEHSTFHIMTVPLYSGFMYASVASYIMQAWRIFDIRLHRFPPQSVCILICAAIYVNFFTEHFVGDFRLALAAAVALLFCRTEVDYKISTARRRMPLLAAFLSIGAFVWVAENIATYCGAWQYPNQHHAWTIVHGSKIGSWTLLVVISFIIVASLKRAFPTADGGRR
jgi:uncharacterized membrane protein YoaT (DUF817 family)